MNKTLFTADLRAHWSLFLFIQLVLLLYGTISVYMFDPESVDALVNMLQILPENMVKAMGFDNLGTDLTEYIAGYLYGFIMIIFPIIYIAILSNNLVAKHVERGSIVYLLTTPNSRVRIALTQALYLLVTLAVLIGVLTGVVLAMCASLFPGMLDVGRFLLLNIVTFLVLAVVSGIAFLGSCAFNETRWSMALGAGLPGLMFIVKMISELNEQLAWVRYLTVFTLMDSENVLAGGSFVTTAVIGTTAAALLLFAGGIALFNRRSLAV